MNVTTPSEQPGTATKLNFKSGSIPKWGGWFERNSAWAFALVGAALAFWLASRRPIPDTIRGVFSATVTIAAIGVGFLMTANSVLVAANNRWLLARAKEVGVFRQLVQYLLQATRWCLFFAGISAAALVYDPSWQLWWYPIGISVWAFFGGGAGAAFCRVLLVFSQVLLGLAEET